MARASSQNSRIGIERVPVAHVDVAQHLRELLHHAGQERQGVAGSVHDVEEQRAGQRAVTGSGVVQEDEVARLLAAEREVARFELVDARGGRPPATSTKSDLVRLEAPPQAEVRHDRADDRVAPQHAAFLHVEGAHGEHLVAVDDARPARRRR